MPQRGNQHKGRCEKCKVTYRWTGGPRLRAAQCPKCGGALSWASWEDKPWEDYWALWKQKFHEGGA